MSSHYSQTTATSQSRQLGHFSESVVFKLHLDRHLASWWPIQTKRSHFDYKWCLLLGLYGVVHKLCRLGWVGEVVVKNHRLYWVKYVKVAEEVKNHRRFWDDGLGFILWNGRNSMLVERILISWAFSKVFFQSVLYSFGSTINYYNVHLMQMTWSHEISASDMTKYFLKYMSQKCRTQHAPYQPWAMLDFLHSSLSVKLAT